MTLRDYLVETGFRYCDRTRLRGLAGRAKDKKTAQSNKYAFQKEISSQCYDLDSPALVALFIYRHIRVKTLVVMMLIHRPNLEQSVDDYAGRKLFLCGKCFLKPRACKLDCLLQLVWLRKKMIGAGYNFQLFRTSERPVKNFCLW